MLHELSPKEFLIQAGQILCERFTISYEGLTSVMSGVLKNLFSKQSVTRSDLGKKELELIKIL